MGRGLGGLFVALVAPVIFADYWELSLGYFIAPLLILTAWAYTSWGRVRTSRRLKSAFALALPPTLIWGAALWIEAVGAHHLLAYNIEKKGWIAGFRETMPRFLRVYQPTVYFQDRDEYGVCLLYTSDAADDP